MRPGGPGAGTEESLLQNRHCNVLVMDALVSTSSKNTPRLQHFERSAEGNPYQPELNPGPVALGVAVIVKKQNKNGLTGKHWAYS